MTEIIFGQKLKRDDFQRLLDDVRAEKILVSFIS